MFQTTNQYSTWKVWDSSSTKKRFAVGDFLYAVLDATSQPANAVGHPAFTSTPTAGENYIAIACTYGYVNGSHLGFPTIIIDDYDDDNENDGALYVPPCERAKTKTSSPTIELCTLPPWWLFHVSFPLENCHQQALLDKTRLLSGNLLQYASKNGHRL